MAKVPHTLECPSRQNNKCNCILGYQRQVKKKAKDILKRQRKKIAEKCNISYEDTLVDTTPRKD